MTETQEAKLQIPELEHRAPDCPLCGAETNNDGCFFCEDCEVYWPDPHGPGKRYDESAPICGAELQPYAKYAETYRGIADNTYRCVRAEGHDGDCRGLLVGKGYAETHSWAAP